MIHINIAKDYTDTPGGRFKAEGPYSGEDFRKEKLIPAMEQAIKEDDEVEINLDGCFGYPSSFLDEAFGGLAKKYGSDLVQKKLKFICEDQPGLEEIIREEYINNITDRANE